VPLMAAVIDPAAIWVSGPAGDMAVDGLKAGLKVATLNQRLNAAWHRTRGSRANTSAIASAAFRTELFRVAFQRHRPRGA